MLERWAHGSLMNVGNPERRKEFGIVPEENALHSGRIGGASKLANEGTSRAVIKKEGRRASDILMVYVRPNLEDPVWVSRALVKGGRVQRGSRARR